MNTEMCVTTQQCKVRGFTLLEMLSALAIISIMVGIFLPALASARRMAKEGAAKIKISQIGTGFRAYYNEYAQWPSSPTNGALWTSILSGSLGVDGTVTNNPRRIIFMEFKKGETNQYGILDPWYTSDPTHAYLFGFDTNYDNTIDVSATLPADANTNTTFIIWSTGDPKKPRLLASWQ